MGGPFSVENEIVSLLPDKSGANYKNFHKEILIELLHGKLHHDVEVLNVRPSDAQGGPAVFCKGAIEEEMKCCLFSTEGAERAGVRNARNLDVLTLENIPRMKSVHEQEPGKNLQLVATKGFPKPYEMSWRVMVLE